MRILHPILFLMVGACDPPPKTTSDAPAENESPTIEILNPSYGSNIGQGEEIEFLAISDDAETAPLDLSISWFSDLDGDLHAESPDEEGYSAFSIDSLSSGAHTITATVTDSNSDSGNDSILVNIFEAGEPPSIAILKPDDDDVGVAGQPLELTAIAEDPDDSLSELDVVFTVESDDQFATCSDGADEEGVVTCTVTLDAGSVDITATVTDPLGQTDTETIANFTIISASEHDNDGDGFSEVDGDCNDDDFTIHPGATELADGIDNDCDEFVDEETDEYDDDGDGFTELEGDCDDSESLVYPGAFEHVDGIDEDCDGEIDNGTIAYDDDGDCFCEGTEDSDTCAGSIATECDDEDLAPGDCNDADEDLNPDAPELCDGIDNDCDGDIDAADPDTDTDGDSYSICGGADCNDSDDSVYPGATEFCNDIDDDCDDVVDEDDAVDASTWFSDSDGDGYGNASSTTEACEEPAGFTGVSGDCNDSDSSIHPGATEVCDPLDTDENCDGSADGSDALGTITYHWDGDEDGYAAEELPASTGVPSSRVGCDPYWKYTVPEPVAESDWDCNDTRADISPGADEVCDPFDTDENCSGEAEEAGALGGLPFYRDRDEDRFGDPMELEYLCAAGTIPEYTVTNNRDCCDIDPTARPYDDDDIDHRSITNACGSYDWNCDGESEKRWTNKGSCSDHLCSTTKGWRYSDEPDCGDAASWLEDCDGLFSCSKDYIIRTQECR